MRKLTRNEKAKIIERVKTAFIVLLSFVCLFLGYHTFQLYRDQTVSDSFLWGSANPMLQGGIFSEYSTDEMRNTFFELSKPELIMINRFESRDAIRETADEFKKVTETIKEVIKEINSLGEESFDMAPKGEWDNGLKVNSVYIRYPNKRSVRIESAFYGIKAGKISEKIQAYEELLLIPDDRNESVTVLFPGDGETVLRVKLKTAVARTLNEIITVGEYSSTKAYVFAHETDFKDAALEDSVSLSPMLLIPTTEETSPEVIVDVPSKYKAGLEFTKTTDFMRGLINIFGYNPNTIRQYVGSNDALTFVSETGSLSVHPQGYIEYKALGKNEGVSLIDNNSQENEIYSVMMGVGSVIDKIFSISGVLPGNSDHSLKLTSVSEIPGESLKFSIAIDYFVDGKKVDFLQDGAVKAVIDNGMLTEFKMQVKTVRKTDKNVMASKLFDEINNYCRENPGVQELGSAKIVYKFSENKKGIQPSWDLQGVR